MSNPRPTVRHTAQTRRYRRARADLSRRIKTSERALSSLASRIISLRSELDTMNTETTRHLFEIEVRASETYRRAARFAWITIPIGLLVGALLQSALRAWLG